MIAAPPAQLDEIPNFYGLCRRALLAAGNEPGLHDLTDLALATATAGNPQLGRLLASCLLPTLKHANEFHRLLAETVLAHLDSAGRLESTAQHLHVHPNTVKYRVKRFIELTGRHPTPSPGTAVTDTAQLWWALQTWLRQ